MISLAISTSGGSLTFTDDPSSGLWIPEDGLGRPGKRWRRQYADSENLHGSILVRATLEQASIPATLYVQDDTTAALEAQMVAVEDALGQFFYTVTLTIDGQATSYSADPADVDWGQVDSGMTRAHMASASVSIPVYPVGA